MDVGLGRETVDEHLDMIVRALDEAVQRGCVRVVLRALRPWELRALIARSLATDEPTVGTPEWRASVLLRVDGERELLSRNE